MELQPLVPGCLIVMIPRLISMAILVPLESVIGGVLSGLFGVGGATIVPPAPTTFFEIRQTAA